MLCNISFQNRAVTKPVDFSDYGFDFPKVIEGVEAYDLLCPVSSVTGCRENPLALLKSLINDPAKSRALDMILAEVPSAADTPAGLSNDQILEQLQSVFSSGTNYENDAFARRLMAISEDLLKTQGIEQPIRDVVKPTVEPAVEPSVE